MRLRHESARTLSRSLSREPRMAFAYAPEHPAITHRKGEHSRGACPVRQKGAVTAPYRVLEGSVFGLTPTDPTEEHVDELSGERPTFEAVQGQTLADHPSHQLRQRAHRHRTEKEHRRR